jgi:hypothetical protein
MAGMTMIDKWSVRAPIEAVYGVMADLRTYTSWGKPTYVACDAEGEPEVGQSAALCIRGALPMQIKFQCEIVRLEPPNVIEIVARGDLMGRWMLRFDRSATGTDVHSTWSIEPQKPVARFLEPLLKPLFRWNHHKAMERTYPGLQSFVDGRIRQAASVASAG